MKTRNEKILLLLSAVVLSVTLWLCWKNPTPTEDIDREAWQNRALTAENALEDACDLLKTAYLEQDELNGPWYVHAAIRITASCQPTRSLGDPHYRGRDANGFYNMEKAP